MLIKLLIVIIVIAKSHCQKPVDCSKASSCDECHGLFGCAWCKENRHDEIQRCINEKETAKSKCPLGSIVKPPASTHIVTKKENLRKNVRISPQKVSAQLSVGSESILKFEFKDETDRPLDLYYIMDLSYTMKDDRTTVSKQADDLVKELKKITSDVRVGFGTFIDKPVLPFVSSSQLRGVLCGRSLMSKCVRYRDDTNYAVPYGFKNELKLIGSVQQFQRTVDNVKQSHNLDEPEGTLDALMQAVTCKEQIGWRNNSRKLIVVATDGPFHIAGDGKLGGIVRPNDMQCHMENNVYTHSTILDYPSIGEMNTAILQNKVYVIFAVSKNSQDATVYDVYKELQKQISQSTVAELKEDSANVKEEIKKKYKEIKGKVELELRKSPENVDVKVEVKCHPKDKFTESKTCNDVEVADLVEYRISLKLKWCPSPIPPNGADKVIISFFQLSDAEQLEISLNYSCSCECSKAPSRNQVELERYCTSPDAAEYLSCGMCTCKEGKSGHFCQCSGDDTGNVTNCIKHGGKDPCENRGECKCGKCNCNQGYNGQFCQDSTRPCQKGDGDDQELCSGSARGDCKEGKCICTDLYEGKFCECEKSKKFRCVEPGKGAVCNGNGDCDCANDRCSCKPGYSGLYCNVCKGNCPDSNRLESRCQDPFLTKCIGCLITKRKDNDTKSDEEYRESCKGDCNEFKFKAVRSSKVRPDVSQFKIFHYAKTTSLSDKEGVPCTLKLLTDGRNCYYDFKYSYNRRGAITNAAETDELEVNYTSEETKCDKEPPYLWIIIGTMLGVLLAGILALLVWKLATHLHDTREYQRFEKERNQARFQGGENPLYLNPMSETQNPAYAQRN